MNIPISFFLKKLLAAALQPPLMPILFIVTGLILMQWRPRAGKIIAWLGVAIMLIVTTPAPVTWLLTPLERYRVVDARDLSKAQAIVILAGGQRRVAPEYGGPTVNRLTLERIRYGTRLAKATQLPVLVTGGAPTGRTPESVLMAKTMISDFGVAPRWIETRSLDTEDNARYSAPMLKAAGIQRVALVTHAAHMLRSVREFQAQGIEVIPAPTALLSGGPAGEEFFDYIPNTTSAYAGWYAVHEWLGIIAQEMRWARGR